MLNKANLEKVRFWCFKVLPLVYDDSLSYYEVLCRVKCKLEEVLVSLDELDDTMQDVQTAISQIQEWIENFDDNAKTIVTEIVEKYIAGAIIFGLTNDGYFCAYIPDSWSKLHFGTITEFPDPLYGHLTLSYD